MVLCLMQAKTMLAGASTPQERLPATHMAQSTTNRVLVTGAAGFVGGACAREFLRRGWQVVALVHRREPENLHGATIVRAAIDNPQAMRDAINSAGPLDAVINCAGRASDVGPDALFRAANYQGVTNIIAAMADAPVARLVHISTTDVYGLRDFDNADESTPFAARPSNPYPRYKIAAEQAIAASLATRQYVILRPGVVWGPGDQTILPRVVDFLRSSPRLIYFGRWRGHNRWPLAHVSNVAKAAFLAVSCDQCLGQAYNVVDPEHTTYDQYNRLVLSTCLPQRAGMKTLCLPMAAGRIIGKTSDVLTTLLRRQQPIFEPTTYALRSVSCNLDFSSAKLEQLMRAQGEQLADRESGFRELGIE